MTQSADQIVERRSLLRSVRLWRFLAFAVLVAAVFLFGSATGKKTMANIDAPYIARFTIAGVITGQPETLEAIEEMRTSKAVKAVILHVNSPGGTTSGAEILYEKLRELAAEKPVVAYVDHMAASGGYIVILAADHIVAQQNALVGSIGVLVQWPEFAGLLKTLGVKMEEVKSAPLKAAPNGFEPASDEAKAAMRAIVEDSYGWFKSLVQTRRGMDADGLKLVTDGRIFTGRQSLPLKLIDSIGQESVAKQWLVEKKQVDSKLKVANWEAKEDWQDKFEKKITQFSKIMGLSGVFGVNSAQYSLDGLVSVWNPASH